MKEGDSCAAGALHAAPLDRFLHRAAPVEARARAAAIPAFARPVVFLGAPGLRFEIRQLHLFPQPIDDVVDAEFERVLDAAVFVAALAALIVAVLLRTADAIAGLGLALADALLLVGVAQLEAIVLEHAHRHAHGAWRRRSAHLRRRRSAADAAAPLREPCRCDAASRVHRARTGRTSPHRPGCAPPPEPPPPDVLSLMSLRNLARSSLPFLGYSCANNVVT